MPGRRLLGRLPEPVKRGLRPLRNLATGEGRTEGIRLAALERMRSTLATERVFWRDDAERLATKLARADAVLPIGQALDLGNDRPLRVAVLRHDTDRDIEASVRLAEWEAGEGLRSTYFVLHTDWYWGSEGPRRPSAFVLRALDRIAALGHEIGVHNNAIAESLRTGHPPEVILGEVLAALRGHGFEVRGTASHGDPLARQLGFVNFEL
ncbi:MAG TPA: hypothetical protein VET90_01805, partial [Candidatus Binatus sp.]|nr:hypothetical protein [Candidatus Binatus sp.]